MNALLNRPQLAIGLAILGFAVFTASDAISRHMVQSLDYNVFFLVAMFQTLGLLVLLAFHKKLGGISTTLNSRQRALHVVRGLMISVSVPANVYAFSVLPFAFTYSLLFTGAFFLLLLSAFITKERIPLHKAFAVVLGMVGALIVLRPWADSFDWRMMIPILSAVMYAFQSLMARRMGGLETPLSLAFFPLVVCGSIMWLTAFVMNSVHIPPVADIPFILGAGFFVGVGTLCVPLAFRYADASVVAPFHYTQLLWGALLGLIFFAEIPNIFTLIGAIFIISGGLMAILGARRKKLT